MHRLELSHHLLLETERFEICQTCVTIFGMKPCFGCYFVEITLVHRERKRKKQMSMKQKVFKRWGGILGAYWKQVTLLHYSLVQCGCQSKRSWDKYLPFEANTIKNCTLGEKRILSSASRWVKRYSEARWKKHCWMGNREEIKPWGVSISRHLVSLWEPDRLGSFWCPSDNLSCTCQELLQ